MKMRWLMLTALVAVFVLGLALAPTAWAQSATATVTANANLRAGPGTSFAKVGSAALGSTVTLAGCTSAGDWCKLSDGAWVFAELLDSVPAGLPAVEDVTGVTPAPTRAAGGLLPTATPSRAAAAATPAPTTAASTSGPVATGAANLRSGPGTGFERVGSVSAGQVLEIVGQTAKGDWYQLADGAWIAAFLVSGAVGEVAVVEAPAAPPSPTVATGESAPAAAQAAPAQTSSSSIVPIGQDVEGKGWRFKVSEVHKRKAVYFYGNSYVAMGHFLVVILDGVNLQGGTDYFYRNIKPYVTDDPGEVYWYSSKGSGYAAWQYEGLATMFTDVNPGNFVRIAIAYDLPDNLGHVMLSTEILKWIDLGDFASMPVEE